MDIEISNSSKGAFERDNGGGNRRQSRKKRRKRKKIDDERESELVGKTEWEHQTYSCCNWVRVPAQSQPVPVGPKWTGANRLPMHIEHG